MTRLGRLVGSILRNPVDRAYSFYKHQIQRAAEPLSFEEAVELEEERLAGRITEAEYRLLRAEQGQLSEVLQRYFQEAIKLDPDDWRALLLSGKILSEQGRHGDAVAAPRKAAARSPDEPSAHYLLWPRRCGSLERSRKASPLSRLSSKLRQTRKSVRCGGCWWRFGEAAACNERLPVENPFGARSASRACRSSSL